MPSGPGPGARSVYAVAITPFTPDGELDVPAARAHLRRLADAGVGAYVGGSGSGEGYTLAPDEVTELLAIAVDEVGDRIPVRAMGREPRTAQEMVDAVADAAAAGVEATQIYSLDVGHGHRPRRDAVETYLRTVLDSTDLPCVLSSHQSVGYRIDVDLYAALLERYPHVAGINCSHADQHYLRQLIAASRGRATVHVGGEAAAMTALAFGAEGFLSSAANLAPRLARSVIDRFVAGDLAGWTDAFSTMHALGGLLYAHGGILATKAVLGRFDLPGGAPRLPHLPLPDDEVDRVEAGVRALGIPEIEQWADVAG